MIRKLSPENFDRIRPLLGADDAFNTLSIEAILAGTNRGAVYVDDIESPRSALIDQTGIVSFFVGDATNPVFLGDLDRFLDQQYAPDMREACGGDTFIAVLHNSAWAQALAPILAARNPEDDTECHFRLAGGPARAPRALPPGFTIARIDAALAAHAVIAEYLLDSWPDIDRFLAQGIGHAVMAGDRAISLCFSCAVWNAYHEINIVTLDDEDRGRGFAAHAGAAWLAEAQRSALIPHWTALASNAASLRLAHKLGFVETARRPTIEFVF